MMTQTESYPVYRSNDDSSLDDQRSPSPSSEKPHILIVEDDGAMRDLLQIILKDDYTVKTANGAQPGLKLLAEQDFDVVLLDIMLGDGNGLDVLRQIKLQQESTEVIMITVVRDLRTAIEAVKIGAFDYINKDFEYDEVKLIINKALEKRKLRGEVQFLRSEIKRYTDIGYIPGDTSAMREINEVVNRIAAMPSNVLIQGESGTGKEVIARRIHDLGQSESDNTFSRPFVSVNIASIPSELLESTLFGHEKGSFTGAHRTHKGKFELADGGTLFLDEIGELKLELQAKLLRAIQEREIERVGGEASIKINVRIIAATNKNLQELVKQGLFREDLFYRLNVIPIKLPPLRERLQDIPLFVDLFLKKYNQKLSKQIRNLDPKVLDCFQAYSWPGNIRELENVLERMVALAANDKLAEEDLPIELRFSADKMDEGKIVYEELLGQAVDAFEKRFLISALQRHGWNQVRTAESIGIHRKTLEYKIKRLKLQELIETNRRSVLP